jgi:protein O-GlcNAc transferase
MLLESLARQKDAVQVLLQAIKLTPNIWNYHYSLGVLLQSQGFHKQAIRAYQNVLIFNPGHIEALENLAVSFKSAGDLKATNQIYKQILASRPLDFFSISKLLSGSSKLCDWDEVVRIQREHQSLGLSGDRVSPFAMLSFEDNAHHQLLRSQSYSKKLEQLDVLDIEEFVSPVRSGGKVRLGYFSSDFRDHPVLHLLMGMLREHDRSSFELYGYSSGRVGECAMREEAKGYFDVFTDINEMSDADVVKLARKHQLDVVVNLNGYTGRPRNEIFAHRVAPVQINYLGFPSTMGADFMDYIVADKVIIPEEYQQYYSEKVLYLPDVYLPNDDKREVANTNTKRSDFGLPEDGFVFCCFNSSYKISPAEFDVWMRILRQVEGSVLWLSNSNKWAVENLKKEAEKRGISADRIIFASRLEKNSEHLARHKHADLFIDTFNYNAHTTAGDALMTGLPLVTKQGEQFAARVASSLLHALDLDELVTRSVEEYEALILELATKPKKLKAIKAKLAKSLASKPAFDTKTYTQNFEQIIKNAGCIVSDN